MNEYTAIKTFCDIDDSCKDFGIKTDPREKVSTSEILFTAFVAMKLFAGNFTKARWFVKNHNFCKTLSKSRFTRRLHNIPEGFIEYMLGRKRQASEEYIVDSFPVSVCRLARMHRSKLFCGEHFRGYNAAHRTWFFGLKAHLITDSDGIPLTYIISPGSEHDMTALKLMDLPLPTGVKLYGDRAYTDYEFEESLAASRGVFLVPQRKTNSKRPHPILLEKRRSKVRKTIETTISSIVRFMPRWIQAVTAKGFELKIQLFILTFSLCELDSVVMKWLYHYTLR